MKENKPIMKRIKGLFKMTKKERDEAKLLVKMVAFGIFIVVSMMFFTDFYMDNKSYEYGTVTGIKTASAGNLFSSSACVYETNKGDVAAVCRYDVGDRIIVRESWG